MTMAFDTLLSLTAPGRLAPSGHMGPLAAAFQGQSMISDIF